jgi:nucleoside-diphosphate-sugar epimerase
MLKISLIGYKGFVGGAIYKALKQGSEKISVKGVDRNTPLAESVEFADIVIHAANSPSRYKATLDSGYDFDESVLKTAKIVSLCHQYQKKLVLVSSISARTELNEPYGYNRKICESIGQTTDCMIFRLGYMFSRRLVYGALGDIVADKPVYLSADSKYSFSDVEWNAEIIAKCVQRFSSGCIYELGASSGITLAEIHQLLGSTAKFEGQRLDIQEAKGDIGFERPPIQSFIKYLNEIKK